MRRKTITRLCAGFGMALPLVAWAADPLGVALTFTARNKCQGESPEIRLTQVPPGTVAYTVRMIDEVGAERPRLRPHREPAWVPTDSGGGVAPPPPPGLTRTIHEQVTNSPPFGLRPAPSGRMLRINCSAEPSSRAQAEGLTTKPGLVLSKRLGSASKPAGPPAAVLRAVMSESAVFVNNPG